MTSESAQSTERFPWTLLLGPGPALAECLPLLETLANSAESNSPTGLEQLETWETLFCDFPEVGRILIDAEIIELKHAGLIDAFLGAHPGWELWLVGTDPAASASRELLRSPEVYWVPAPLDVRSLKESLTPPMLWVATEEVDDYEFDEYEEDEFDDEDFDAELPDLEAVDLSEGESVADSLDTEDSEDEGDDLLAQVERILRGEADPPTDSASSPGSVGSESRQDETGSAERTTSLTRATEPQVPMARTPRVTPGPEAPAKYFRHQVADLADIVQCIDLGLDRTLQEADSADSKSALAGRLDELRAETLRLRQYTRTLAYIVSPPGRGEQKFDLAPLLEEMLTTRGSETDAPRYLIRTPDALLLRSDKQLIEQALDALLFLAHKSAGPDGTVRVDGRLDDVPELGGQVRLSIRFPAGRFSDLSPDQLLEPYGLRRLLPELGANAIAAANGILRGQGGRLALYQESSGGLEWVVHLPYEE